MYLKKLTLSGFKSFADPTEFHFHRGTTSIVGPNGCGKSNVVDAFRWVLGERSAKELRGSEMLDVIFKGTTNRTALSRAEVSLLFDNADGRLPLEFAEVEVSRRLFRSGESEYLINKRRVRLKDVRALFADTGLGTEGYSILEQGNVDAFLHSNPEQRRELFEEAAGISRYKKQRVQAQRQLERVVANVQRLTDILGEVERRIRSVKIQAGKARRYLEDRDLIVKLRAVLSADEMERYLAERELVTFRLAYAAAEKGIVEDLTLRVEQERDGARRGLESARQSLEQIREQEMELRVSLERIAQRRSHLREKMEEAQEAAKHRRVQHQELQAVERDYLERREELRSRMRGELAELREIRCNFDEIDRQRSALVARKVDLEQTVRAGKERSLSLLFTQTKLSNEKTSLESEIRGLRALRERREREGAEFDKNFMRIADERRATQEEQRRLRALAEDAAERRAVVQEELARRDELLGEANRRLADLREEHESAQARLRFLEGLEESREGVGKGARELLATRHPIGRDVLGLLADGIEVEPHVAPMVDAVLGSLSDMVLLADDTPLEDRVRVLARLLEGNGVTVCQVGGERARDGDNPAADETSGVPLTSLITADPPHAALLERLFGSVRVVDDLDEALSLASRPANGFRYVTPSGVLVEPWGAVTLPANGDGGLVSRHAEIQRLRHDGEVRARELQRWEEHENALQVGIEARRAELRAVEEESQRTALRIESLERRSRELGNELARVQERREVVKAEIAELDAGLVESRNSLTEVEERTAAVTAERDTLNQEVESGENDLSALDDDLQGVEERISQLRVSSTQKEERVVALRREETRLLGEVRERQARRKWLEEEEQREEERHRLRGEELDRLVNEGEELEEALSRLEDKATAAEEEVGHRNQELEGSERTVAGLRAHGEGLRERREEALLRENECRVRIASIREKLAEEFELDLRAAPVDEWRRQLEKEDESGEEFLRRVREELENVQERLRRNANVNLEAVEELAELEERFGFLSGQLEDLERSRVGLLETIEELNDKSRDLFIETFQEVRLHFQKLFASIFNGGTADLVLEEGVDVLEAGVRVVARPPGKKISSLNLLSGGEKALTAISVLFALFRWRPSPFCILDEVDAPLDESNVRRFVRALQEFSGESQFIIITHNKVTMSHAERLYGITMEEQGVSRMVAVRIEDVDDLKGKEAHARSRPGAASLAAEPRPKRLLGSP